jgi:predicted phage terminase large subunit-like protein
LIRRLAGFRVGSTPEKGSKELRAGGVATQVSNGTVSLRRAHWNAAFIEELAAFPHGDKDDQVDALSRAFGMLTESAAPARFMSLPHLAR